MYILPVGSESQDSVLAGSVSLLLVSQGPDQGAAQQSSYWENVRRIRFQGHCYWQNLVLCGCRTEGLVSPQPVATLRAWRPLPSPSVQARISEAVGLAVH